MPPVVLVGPSSCTLLSPVARKTMSQQVAICAVIAIISLGCVVSNAVLHISRRVEAHKQNSSMLCFMQTPPCNCAPLCMCRWCMGLTSKGGPASGVLYGRVSQKTGQSH